MLRRVVDGVRTMQSSVIEHRLRVRHGIEIGKGCHFHGTPIVTKIHPSCRIILGDNVTLTSDSQRNPLGLNHPVMLSAVHPGAVIEIGANTGISGAALNSVISISIGQGCLLGANVTIADTDFHPVDARGRRYLPTPEPRDEHRVVIGDDVLIGMGAIILKGVRIGDGSVVGAGAVVSSSVEPGQIVAGNPARVIRAVRLD